MREHSRQEVRDVAQLRDFALDTLTAPPDVARVETSLVFEYSRGA